MNSDFCADCCRRNRAARTDPTVLPKRRSDNSAVPLDRRACGDGRIGGYPTAKPDLDTGKSLLESPGLHTTLQVSQKLHQRTPAPVAGLDLSPALIDCFSAS